MKKKFQEEKQDTKKNVLIVDGSTLAYAALYSTGTLSYNGKGTGVKFGFYRKLLSLVEKFKTNDFIICWDSHYSHREKIYSNYKKKRKDRREQEKDDVKIEERKSFIEQITSLKKEVIQMGFKNTFEQQGFEADDLLAYWVNKLYKYYNVVLITSDNDLFQCLDKCCMWMPQQKKMVTEKTFYEKYKVHPSQWPICKSIGGCSGDNVIGIKGAADPKNPSSQAIKYVNGEIKKGVLYNRINSKEGQETIETNKQLVVLPFPGVPLRRMIKRKNQFSRKEFIRVFDKNRFISFLDGDSFKKWEKLFKIERR